MGSKILNCDCKSGGRVDCQWTLNKNKNTRCYEQKTRRFWNLGESFTKVGGRGRTLDCTCKKQSQTSSQLVIECTTNNRCHHEGKSYVQGYRWYHTDEEGIKFRCLCLALAVVSCKATVPTRTIETISKRPTSYGTERVRDNIAGFQACDIGHRVVSAGFAWNETKHVSEDVVTIKSCVCYNAIITCKDVLKSRSREPHCLTEDGEIHPVGSVWVENHKYTKNLKWRCHCDGNARAQCSDEGTCPDLIPPANGAMLCITAGDRGSDKRTKYCKPLCEQGYDFQSRERRYRAYETCGRLNSHRWASGYVENHLLIAKCIPSSRRYSYYRHYIQGCETMTEYSKNQIKDSFMRLLTRRRLCQYGCKFESFTCG